MTTHHIEIRLAALHDTERPWEPLTRSPIEAHKAAELCLAIGPLWESRIVSAVQGDFSTEVARLLAYRGDPNQIARHQAGVLPLEEVRTLARRSLFGPFEERAQVDRWHKAEIVHHPSCGRPTAEVWAVTPCEILTGNQWFAQRALLDALSIIRDVATELGLTLAPRLLTARRHAAKCRECGGAGEGISVQVVIHWGEHALAREYVL